MMVSLPPRLKLPLTFGRAEKSADLANGCLSQSASGNGGLIGIGVEQGDRMKGGRSISQPTRGELDVLQLVHGSFGRANY